MGKLAEAYVEVRADGSKLGADLEQSKGKLDGWARNVGAGVGAVIGVAIARLGDYMAAATQKAADLAESTAKIGEAFGPSAGMVATFADKLAEQYGVVKREALDAASSFGLIAQGMGMSEAESAKLSTTLVRTAADLASFHNLGTKEVLEKLRAGLSGEMEPLRVLGINLSESNVEANAFATGLVRAGQSMSEYARIVSRADLIQKQSAKAIGDLDRTYDSLSNKQKRMAGDLENFQTQFGESLLGPANEAVSLMYDLGDAIAGVSGSSGGLQGLSDILTAIVDQLRFLVGFDPVAGISETLNMIGAEVFGDTFGNKSRLFEIQTDRAHYLQETDAARKKARIAASPAGTGDDAWKAGDGSAVGPDGRNAAKEAKKAREEAEKAEKKAMDEELRAAQSREKRADHLFESVMTAGEKFDAEKREARGFRDSGLIDDGTYGRLVGRSSGVDHDVEALQERIADAQANRRDPGRVLGDLASSHNALQNQALDDTPKRSLDTLQDSLKELKSIREALMNDEPEAFNRLQDARAVLKGRE